MKKFFAAFCMFALIMSLSLDKVSAANTGNIDIVSFKATVYGYKALDSGAAKTDDTAVYVHIETSNPYSTVRARALGGNSSSGSWTNRTYISGQGTVTYVTLTAGSTYHYEIHNLIYESGETHANLSFHSTGTDPDYITGVWSPDCAGSYTYARQ